MAADSYMIKNRTHGCAKAPKHRRVCDGPKSGPPTVTSYRKYNAINIRILRKRFETDPQTQHKSNLATKVFSFYREEIEGI